MRAWKSLVTAAATGLGLALSISLANAADVYEGGSLKDSPADATPYIGWAGFYAGGHLGGVWDDSEDAELFDDTAFTAGIHGGYNWQMSDVFVAGLEADLGFVDDVDYLASIRGRLGYTTGPMLAYVTGGIAFIGFDDDVFGDDAETGYVIGAGLDYKLRDNWSIGGDALYYGFDDAGDTGHDANFWVARARLTYHLGGRY